MTAPDGKDPGNSQPEEWTEDLTDDEAREAYAAVESVDVNKRIEVQR